MVLLLISPFIPELKSELIIVAAGILLMLPGIEVVKYDQLAKSEAFTQTIYICCFIGLAGILSSAGVVDVLTAGFQSMMPSPALRIYSRGPAVRPHHCPVQFSPGSRGAPPS